MPRLSGCGSEGAEIRLNLMLRRYCEKDIMKNDIINLTIVFGHINHVSSISKMGTRIFGYLPKFA